jgi:hypothetical protein
MSREAIAELGLGYYLSKDEIAVTLKEQNHNLEIAEEVGVLTRKWEGYVTRERCGLSGLGKTLGSSEDRATLARTDRAQEICLLESQG